MPTAEATKTKFQIKSRLGSVLFEYECASIKECVEEAVKARANLARANIAIRDHIRISVKAA